MKEDKLKTLSEDKKSSYMDLLEAMVEDYINLPTEEGVTLLKQDMLTLKPRERVQMIERFLNYWKSMILATYLSDESVAIKTSLEQQLIEMMRES